jgi:hypothetical protein
VQFRLQIFDEFLRPQTITNSALTKCESMGFKVSVVVVDRDGLPIVMLRGDGSGLHPPEGVDRTWRLLSADSRHRRIAANRPVLTLFGRSAQCKPAHFRPF